MRITALLLCVWFTGCDSMGGGDGGGGADMATPKPEECLDVPSGVCGSEPVAKWCAGVRGCALNPAGVGDGYHQIDCGGGATRITNKTAIGFTLIELNYDSTGALVGGTRFMDTEGACGDRLDGAGTMIASCCTANECAKDTDCEWMQCAQINAEPTCLKGAPRRCACK